METILNYMSTFMLNNIYFAPFASLIGGIIASFTPCCLSQLPLFITYISSINKEAKDSKNTNAKDIKKQIIKNTMLYCTSNVITFTIMGIVIALVGRVFSYFGKIFYIFLGILMLYVFLRMINVINNNRCVPISKYIKKLRKNKIGVILLGSFSAIFSSTCSFPIMIAILSIITITKNIVIGIISLLLYSIGSVTLIVVCSISINYITKLSNSSKYLKLYHVIYKCSAFLILLLGLYMFYLGF